LVAVLDPKRFKLPRVEREKFILLMNQGLDYNRERGIFSVKNCTHIEKLMNTLVGILGTEVVFLQSCERCGKEFPCSECKYYELCSTRDLPLTCMCPQCLRDKKQFEQYLEKF